MTSGPDDSGLSVSETLSCFQGRKAKGAGMEDAGRPLRRCPDSCRSPLRFVGTTGEEEDEDCGGRIWAFVQVCFWL